MAGRAGTHIVPDGAARQAPRRGAGAGRAVGRFGRASARAHSKE